jgi:hypothetical protein
MALDQNLFRNWIDGDTFSARDYVYERNSIIAYINGLPSVGVLLQAVEDDYYNKQQLNDGQLDNRYYTKTELKPANATQGAAELDSRYYTKNSIDDDFNDDRDRLAAIETIAGGVYNASTNPNGLIGTPSFDSQWFDQTLKTDDHVEFASVKLGANTVNEAFIDGLENKYTTTQADDKFVAKAQLGAQTVGDVIGVATLDDTGRLPVRQLPIDTVVFRGTFGDGVGDLPDGSVNKPVETGDFYICISNGYESVVADPLVFDTGDKAVYDGTNWSKIDNTETVTSVSGSDHREGNPTIGAVTLNYEDVGAAADDHVHGNISNAGAIGSSDNQVVITGTSGVLTTATRSGIDSRTSFPPSSHTHGNITNDGKIGSTSDQVVVTGTDGVLSTVSRSGIDSRSEYPPVAHTHDDRYFTKTELKPASPTQGDAELDSRYYTQGSINSTLNNYILSNTKGVANGVVPLDTNTKIDAIYLPSYVDDVLEGYYDTNTDAFYGEATFENVIAASSGKIYVDITTKKTYRYSGSGYVEIAANEVNSVNGEVGVVVLDAGDIEVTAAGFTGVLTTDDDDIQTALTTLDGHTHDYADITEKPDFYTEAEMDALLAEKANTADLAATITLYPTTTPSAVSGYFTLVDSPDDVRYNDTAFNFDTQVINDGVGVEMDLGGFLSDVNVFTGSPGYINITTIGNIRKTAGNTNAFAEFYFKVFKYGETTPFATSNPTGGVNPETLDQYFEFSASAPIVQPVNFLSTDRIEIRYYARAIEGTTSRYDFQIGGDTPVRTFLPVPVRVLQSAERIVYDNTTSSLAATNLQTAVDELDQLIQENTSVIKIQRFVITNADNGNGTFSYTFDGNARTGTLATGQYRFDLEDDVEYIVNQNRLEIKINNDVNFYSPDLEIEEIDKDTIGITYAIQTNDEVFIKVYQGLDSVALVVADGAVTTAKLSTALQNDLTSYSNHIASTANPHGVTKSQVGLSAVTNDAQMKKIASNTNGNVPIWSGTAGDTLADGYGVQTTLSSSTTALVRADAIQSAVNSLSSSIDTKQNTLVSGTNIKTINNTSIVGPGNYEIDIPSVDVQANPPDLQTANVGDLWWNTNNAVLYIAYDDGDSKQWVEVSYADIQAEINALINGAPGALDTLNELAAALGDDPNFATTITNALAGKASTQSVTDLTTTVNTKANKLATFVTVSADYTILASDAGKVLQCTNDVNTDIEITVPDTGDLAVGTQIAILRNGEGAVTFKPATNVTINSAEDLLDISVQYASAALIKMGANTWQLIGSLG